MATWSFCRSQVGSRPTYSCVRYQAGREPGIGPAQSACPNTDTDHSDQSVPVLFAPLFLEGPVRVPPVIVSPTGAIRELRDPDASDEDDE